MAKMHSSVFEYSKPSETQVERMDLLRQGYARMLHIIETVVPDGRYRALAITDLETSAMWANKAVTRLSDGTPIGGANGEGRDADAEAGVEAQPQEGARQAAQE